MGRINTLWNPKYWYSTLEGINKNDKNDVVYDMVIGEGEDYCDYYNITQFISKINYERILSGLYSVKTFPYSENVILLFDENNNIIPLVKNTNIGLINLTKDQEKLVKEYSLVKKKSRNKKVIKY